MPARRVLSIWFPRLAAERALRVEPQLAGAAFAVVAEAAGLLTLASLSAEAEAAGLRRGMTLGDARAICPGLLTRSEDPLRAAPFLGALRRWAGRFSPWVATEPPDGLALDMTGCAHLFGGEAGLVAAIETGAADLGLGPRIGVADTLGAAWALARYAAGPAGPAHAGDAIDQEARATRSRAQKRRWERGGAPPPPAVPRGGDGAAARIAPPGTILERIGPLPAAALRLTSDEVAALQALGLVRIADLAALPRAALARRAGPGVLARLDQALGRSPEPLAPARPEPVFALRLTLPEPIGREADVLAGLDRLLDPLCARLRAAGVGTRRVRLTLIRVDRGAQAIEAGLARAADAPDAIRPLLALQAGAIDAGFGIEALRLEALGVEPVTARQHRGQFAVSRAATRRDADAAEADPEALADLVGRLGARLGLEALTRLHPADSHIPEKSATVMAAGFAPPARAWPEPVAPRPVLIFGPEPVTPQDGASPPQEFVWRRRPRRRSVAFGPERIAPEWWLDDPAWRSGPRDYWRVETEEGDRLWLYEARGAETTGGWFAQGVFA